MRSLLRLVLLCLMAVALPVQGFAAAGALHCGAMHERMQSAGEHHHDGGAAHRHHDDAASSHDTAAGDAGADDGATRIGGAVKCSACAACCVGLGLPATAVTLPQGPAEGLSPQPAARAVAAFLTDGLERPPRIVLA